PMRSRRRKTSVGRSLFLWTICLALVGGGLYWANELRRMLPERPREEMPEVAASAGVDGQGGDSVAEEVAANASGLLPVLRPEALLGDGTEPLATVEAPSYPTFDAALSAEELYARGMQLLDKGEVVG